MSKSQNNLHKASYKIYSHMSSRHLNRGHPHISLPIGNDNNLSSSNFACALLVLLIPVLIVPMSTVNPTDRLHDYFTSPRLSPLKHNQTDLGMA